MPESQAMPVVDPDLTSASCTGMGVMYPQVWDVIQRYILRGDDFYQSGGLSILASTAWNMPLSEAADILELYFARHSYFPQAPPRGGISLPPLKAAYAVGTTPGWDGSDLEARRQRMIALLERCIQALTADPTTSDPMYKGDIAIVRETIDAIRADRSGFEPDYQQRQEEALGRQAAGRKTATDERFMAPPQSRTMAHQRRDLQREGTSTTGHITAPPISKDDVAALVREAVDTLRHDLEPRMLTQLDLQMAKHGGEMLSQQTTLTERRLDDRITALDRQIDRHMTDRQISSGNQQVGLNRASLAVAVITGIVSMAVSVAVALFLG